MLQRRLQTNNAQPLKKKSKEQQLSPCTYGPCPWVFCSMSQKPFTLSRSPKTDWQTARSDFFKVIAYLMVFVKLLTVHPLIRTFTFWRPYPHFQKTFIPHYIFCFFSQNLTMISSKRNPAKDRLSPCPMLDSFKNPSLASSCLSENLWPIQHLSAPSIFKRR